MLQDQAPGRVIILVTDGQETTSATTLRQAISAARAAHVSLYPVAIQSHSFSPTPLRRLARRTGGTYYAAATSGALTDIYARIGRELRRTWRIEYPTRARPGDALHLRVVVRGVGAAATVIRVPGRASSSSARPLSNFTLLAGLALAAGLLLLVLGAWFRSGTLSHRWSRDIDD